MEDVSTIRQILVATMQAKQAKVHTWRHVTLPAFHIGEALVRRAINSSAHFLGHGGALALEGWTLLTCGIPLGELVLVHPRFGRVPRRLVWVVLCGKLVLRAGYCLLLLLLLDRHLLVTKANWISLIGIRLLWHHTRLLSTWPKCLV